MTKPFKITELYAWVIEDPTDGDEGVPAIEGPLGPMPLIGADGARIESLRPAAENVARQVGRPVRLCKFSQMEVLEEIQP